MTNKQEIRALLAGKLAASAEPVPLERLWEVARARWPELQEEYASRPLMKLGAILRSDPERRFVRHAVGHDALWGLATSRDAEEQGLRDLIALLEPIAWPEGAGIAISPLDDDLPVIEGTRFAVDIVRSVGEGYSLRATGEDRWHLHNLIAQGFEYLTAPQIDAALDYYAAHSPLFSRSQYQRCASQEQLLGIAQRLGAALLPLLGAR